MEKVIDILQLLLTLGALGTFFIGIIKPSFVIKREFFGRRLLLIMASLAMIHLHENLEDYKVEHVYTEEEREQYYAEKRERFVRDSIKREEEKREKLMHDSIKSKDNTKTITISIDTALVIVYKHKFDSLYNIVAEVDKGKRPSDGIAYKHKEIRKLLKEWLNTMDKIDPEDKKLPYSTREWTKATDRYYNLGRKFDLYGDGDEFSIRYWAEYDAEKALRKVLNDPGSLEIDDNDIQVYKTSKGWRCVVPYRAKNLFGAYVLDTIILIMNYDVENSIYKSVDASY